ncbi:hypothetical protein ACHAXM_005707 [Skeletonema potamos]
MTLKRLAAATTLLLAAGGSLQDVTSFSPPQVLSWRSRLPPKNIAATNSKLVSKSSATTTSLHAMTIPSWTYYSLAHILGSPIVISGTKKGSWFDRIPKPKINPPNFVFGPVWTLLYGLMGVSVSRIVKAASSSSSAAASGALKLWYAHYALNLIWAPIFFGLKRFRLGFITTTILVLILARILPLYHAIDPTAAYLQIPYLVWLMFASVLNHQFCVEEDEVEVAFDSYFQSAQEGWNTATDGRSRNDYDMFRRLEEQMKNEEEQKRLRRQRTANDPHSKDEVISAQITNTPLADIANGMKSTRKYSPNRTRLSSEQPSPQRQQNGGRGAVMESRSNTLNNDSRPFSTVAREAYEKSRAQANRSTPLSEDFLKGSEAKREARQQKKSGAVIIEIIDAVIVDGQGESSQPKSNRVWFAEAPKGGPQSKKAKSSTFNSANNLTEENDMSNVIRRAQEIIADDPKLRYMATIAQSNPKIREAVEACMGNPSAFGQYLNDQEIGPILEAMRKSI